MTLGQDGQTYYKLYSNSRTWWNAENACKNAWGLDGLAPFNTEDMIKNIYGLIGTSNFNEDTYIDVRNPSNQDCNSKVACNLILRDRAGNPITTNLAYVTHEFKMNHDPNNDERRCVKVKRNTGKWEDEECDDDKYPLCYQVCAPPVTCDGSTAPTLANSNDNNTWTSASPASENDVIT